MRQEEKQRKKEKGRKNRDEKQRKENEYANYLFFLNIWEGLFQIGLGYIIHTYLFRSLTPVPIRSLTPVPTVICSSATLLKNRMKKSLEEAIANQRMSNQVKVQSPAPVNYLKTTPMFNQSISSSASASSLNLLNVNSTNNSLHMSASTPQTISAHQSTDGRPQAKSSVQSKPKARTVRTKAPQKVKVLW